MQRVRVGVVVASRDGAWAFPVPSDDFDARAWRETFEGQAFEGLHELVVEIAQRMSGAEFDDFDVRKLALVNVDGNPEPLAVFLAVTDVPDLTPHVNLRRFDFLETEYLQSNTTDVALAIALRHLEVLGLRGDHRSPWGPEQTMPERSTALALLHERLSDDGTTWTATYVCEVSGNNTVVRGPSAAKPTEALAWGRARADTVLFFFGDLPGRPHNAGATLDDDPQTGQPWPTVPEPVDLQPRPARPAHHVTYRPLHSTDDTPPA
ncbi:hypothetical protein AB0L40_26370 [Patulibacter sp. NPDC049589]|uniref:hypothetical protein n=1 Tax=Patulibacter sp. NPDC049589 TaxID=3154731 RepID=UPI0034375AB5